MSLCAHVRAAHVCVYVCVVCLYVGVPTRYLVVDGDLLEIQRIHHAPSSWFIGEDIIQDGSMYLCTRVDPVYLLLPILLKARQTHSTEVG